MQLKGSFYSKTYFNKLYFTYGVSLNLCGLFYKAICFKSCLVLFCSCVFSSPELCSGRAVVITFRPSSVRPLTFSNDFSSEAAEPILLKFHMEPP